MNLLAPETIKPIDLPWTPLKHYQALPNCPCLYFVLTANQEMGYIGRATQLKARWGQHHRLEEFRSHPDCRIAWLEVSDPLLLPALEQACIAYFQPLYNHKQGRRPLGEENLIDTHIHLPQDLKRWAESQPEGLSGLMRDLLAAERARRTPMSS